MVVRRGSTVFTGEDLRGGLRVECKNVETNGGKGERGILGPNFMDRHCKKTFANYKLVYSNDAEALLTLWQILGTENFK